jgi:transglutaminase superfamily protein
MLSRRVVAVLVLGAWGTGLAILARQEAHRPDSDHLAAVALRIAPGAIWFSAERRGMTVGFASITVDTAPRQLRVTEYQVLGAQDPGIRSSRQTTVRLSRGLALHDVERDVVHGSDSIRIVARALNDSTVALYEHGFDGDELAEVRHARAVFVGALIPLVVVLREQPRVGSLIGIDVLDLDSRRVRSLAVRIAAESVFTTPDSATFDRTSGRWRPIHHDAAHGYRLVSTGDSTLDMWVDELGRPILMRSDDAVTWRRTAFELAFENWRLNNPLAGMSARAGSHMVVSTLLAARAVPAYRMLDTLRVKVLSRLPGSLLQQFRQGDVITTVHPEATVLTSDSALPPDERGRRFRSGAARREPGIETDDPRIVRLAIRLRGADRDPAKVAQRILNWVHDSLVADPSKANLTAAQGLDARRGDCDVYSRLFIALARAAGIPAQGAVGLLFAGGNFYYHTWARVILDRHPIDVDPMLGQLPADAAHLRSMTGSLESQPEQMRRMAGLELQLIGMTPSAAGR